MDKKRKKYEPAVGPRLKPLLAAVFALFALMVVDSLYLVAVTIAGVEYQNWTYLVLFLVHLVLGLLIVVPLVAFGVLHWRTAHDRPNRRAVRVGQALFLTSLVLLLTGFVLLRVDVFGLRFEVNQPTLRGIAYWLHVLTPLAAIWLFVIHRLAGNPIKWKVGLAWAAVAAAFAAGMLVLQAQDPRAWNVAGPESGDVYFQPSLARTTTGNFIPERVLNNDAYCKECHADVHDQWLSSAHRLASFNNPAYEFSVKNTRRALLERDGTVKASRFCAGCHDPVPFFTGAFDDPRFDDPEYDLASDRFAQAGITCTSCHAISHVNSVRGNADYTIDEPVHYPFTFSDSSFLRWVNRQLVKAKPEFHKATFLKEDVHRSTDFCGSCHKVFLPEELNAYKWLRGQDHRTAFWLSGVSGHGITSFYYPPKAEENCNGCHMPLREVSDRPNFSARVRDESGTPKTFGHQFPSANTAIVHLKGDEMPDPELAMERHREINEGVMRVDLFALRADGRVDGELLGPLRPELPELEPGREYLVETVVRTVKMGHLFTQGTVDSNEVWVEVLARDGAGRLIGRNGGMASGSNETDPWAHFINAFVIDREGNRIDRRNAEDIFVPLYNHQIPPGAADSLHYRLEVPEDVVGPVTLEARLHYRKFDTLYYRLFTGDMERENDLPILLLAEDSVTLPVRGRAKAPEAGEPPAPDWMRWNDYGIGLLRKAKGGQLRQAREAFERVEALGRPDGPLNLARAYLAEGLVQSDAPAALARAAEADPPAPPWSLLWFGAQVAARNGDHQRAAENLRDILRGGFAEAAGRGFDFSKDWRVRNALARSLYQLASLSSGSERDALLDEATSQYDTVLELDPENLEAHWGLAQVYRAVGDETGEERHAALHAKYKPDDNARDVAVAQARLKYPAANKAAEAVVIYDLHRAGAPGMDEVAR